MPNSNLHSRDAIEAAIADYVDGASIPMVSERTGIPKSTLRHHLKKRGVLRSRTDGVRRATAEGRIVSPTKGKKLTFTEEHKRNISESRQKWAAEHAVGTSISSGGYVCTRLALTRAVPFTP